jgi:hypothetical protein
MITSGDNAESSPGGEQLVTSLRPTDVLCGRGSGPSDHVGNILFRCSVKERKSEYTATVNRKNKAKIAREIVDAVLAKNGRFLKQIDPAEAKKLGIPYEVDVWLPVDEQTCMEKTKQALRQKVENGQSDFLVSPPSKTASVSTSENTSASMSPDSQDRYAHETSDLQDRYSTISLSSDMNHEESHWNTSPSNRLPMYAQSPGQLSHQPPGAFLLTEEAPPGQQMSRHRIAEWNPERCAEKVHHNAFYREDEELHYGPENDALETFHQGGADEMEIFHDSSSNSSDTMGTAESLVTIDASNASVISMLSAFTGALFDTPRCAPRLGGDCQDPSLFSYHRESSDRYTYSYDSENNGQSFGNRFSYGRDASRRIPRTLYVGASDLSTPSSTVDDFLGESPKQPGKEY